MQPGTGLQPQPPGAALPNRTISITGKAIEAQLTAANGPAARPEPLWMARASNGLPGAGFGADQPGQIARHGAAHGRHQRVDLRVARLRVFQALDWLRGRGDLTRQAVDTSSPPTPREPCQEPVRRA